MQYDTYINDAAGHPLASYGPRLLNGNNVEECPPEEAEFWGVYRHVPQQGHAGETVYHAECVGDAHDKDSAQTFADMVARARKPSAPSCSVKLHLPPIRTGEPT